MNKEECEKALNNLNDLSCFPGNKESTYYPILYQLIQEHFDPQPYKFEDLKPDMWICDDKFKDCMKIKIVFEPCKLYPNGSFKAYHDLNEKELNFVEFEEGRFFPVTKAMEYQK